MNPTGFGSIAEQLRRSTVQVTTETRHRGQGSGIIVRSDGVIVTNAHVADRAPLTVHLWDGNSFPACIKERSAHRDLAVLQIAAANLTPATLANSDGLRVGELVIAVGNPLGFTGAVSTGVVHAISARWIQAAVQLAPGNSGGPLADARGNVIGVNTMVAGGLGLAVPSNVVSRLLAGKLKQASLGVTVRPAPIRVAGKKRVGLLILEVTRGGAAEYASLREGDVLLMSLEELGDALEQQEERPLRLEIIRGDPNRVRAVVVRPGISQASAA